MCNLKSKKRIRLTKEARRAQLLEIAIELSKKLGYKSITRLQISQAAQTTESLVSYHFGSIRGLQEAILLEAKNRKITEIITQAIGLGEIKLTRGNKKLLVDLIRK